MKRAYAETKEEHENDLKRAVDAARALEKEKKAHKETMQQHQETERALADAQAARQAAEKETRRLQQEIDENNELLDAMQEECNKAQQELLNLQSQNRQRRRSAAAGRRADAGGFRNGCAAVYRHMRPDAAHGQRVCGHADGNAPEIRRAAEDD